MVFITSQDNVHAYPSVCQSTHSRRWLEYIIVKFNMSASNTIVMLALMLQFRHVLCKAERRVGNNNIMYMKVEVFLVHMLCHLVNSC